MRTSTALLALPALSAAQQFPLMDQVNQIKDQVMGWLGQASSSVSSVMPSAPTSIPNPATAAAAKVASLSVERLTLANHKELLQPGAATASPGIDEWMIFVTGGNKTCFGLCGRSEEAWNISVPLIAAAPNPPNLALLNCEGMDGVLCNAWAVSPPQILYFQLPQPLPDQSTPATTVRAIAVNRTTVTAPEIAAVYLQEKYKETAPYEGLWHPFDGPLAQYGLNIPAGYAIWGFSQIPSWAFMIVVSMVSRNVMSKRAAAPAGGRGAAPAAS